MFSVTDLSLERNTKVKDLWVVGLHPSEQSSRRWQHKSKYRGPSLRSG